jgi:uroporphyrinogen decarboxylase
MNAAVTGIKPDQIPVGLWFHFGGETLTPEEQAAIYIHNIRTQKWDFLKVMFEYRPYIPDNLNIFNSHDLQSLLDHTDWEAPFRLQQKCIESLCNELKDEVPIVESGYSPWFMLLRLLGRDCASSLILNSNITHRILAELTFQFCNHIKKIKKLGVYGYFHATLAASKDHSIDGFDFQIKYDHEILSAAKNMVRMLHLHGSHLSIQSIQGYPFEVLSTSDRDSTNPSLKQIRNEVPQCLMGGICEKSLTQLSTNKIQEQIASAILDAGDKGFILAPGCSVSASVSIRTMKNIKNSKHLII